MKILTISNAAWDDRNSVGNTQSNWFSGWKDIELFSMYTRQCPPNNKCCHHYYSVTIEDIMRHIMCWDRIGAEFDSLSALYSSSSSFESRAMVDIKGWKKSLAKFFIEALYSSRIWLNKRMKRYLHKINPDIVFCFAIAEPFRYAIIKYIRAHMQSKIVMWIADDVYGQAKSQKGILGSIYQKRYYALFSMADKLYGVSDKLCDEYSQRFKISIAPLYKGCDFSPCRKDCNHPLQMVYAGNLLYGRDETLAMIVKQLRSFNRGDPQIQLSIYSSTVIAKETYESLNIEGTSKLFGVKPYEEILQIMNSADIVLHVESFIPAQIERVRLSFSTKIIDCMQSGAAMMVIGPKGIASVEYPRQIPGVIVVDNLDGIFDELQRIVKTPSNLISNSLLMRQYAIENHSRTKVQHFLQEEFRLLTC